MVRSKILPPIGKGKKQKLNRVKLLRLAEKVKKILKKEEKFLKKSEDYSSSRNAFGY